MKTWKYITCIHHVARLAAHGIRGYRVVSNDEDGSEFTICDIFPMPYPVAVDENHARLIAAAPDMLEALEAIMNGQLVGRVDTHAERFQKARAAIAKATAPPTPVGWDHV